MKKLVTLLYFSLAAAVLPAQMTVPQADALFNTSDWPKALDAYQELVKLGVTPARQYFRMARIYAHLNEPDKVFEALNQSVKLGFAQSPLLQAEADFGPFHKDPRYPKLVADMDRAAHPCRTTPEYRGFDFWLGEWNVQTPQGVVFASSSIQLVTDDCVIFENYDMGHGAYVGKSFTAYDAQSKQWVQHWIDGAGRFTDYVGEATPGVMSMRTESVVNGVPTKVKMTFTALAPDKVRQHLENSIDGGKTWTTAFDGIYVRKK